MPRISYPILLLMLLSVFTLRGQDTLRLDVIDGYSQVAIPEVEVRVGSRWFTSNSDGTVEINNPEKSDVLFRRIGYFEVSKKWATLFNNRTVSLIPNIELLEDVQLSGYRGGDAYAEVQFLGGVENQTIHVAKKNELVLLKKSFHNPSTGSPRQLFAQVPGIHVWESSTSGIQLEIGSRGLSPKRSSNFNVRQDEVDISADAIGYPEAYYTPPLEAVEAIEIKRGAAALQYGPQFGGLINFRLKPLPTKAQSEFMVQQNVGSFGLYSTYLEGKVRKGNTAVGGFLKYQQAEGARPNENLQSIAANIRWKQEVSWGSLEADFTKMTYLAHQPGGLTDRQFLENPLQSVRSNNWFGVDWNVFRVGSKMYLSDKTSIDSRVFGLIARRSSLGRLQNISWNENQLPVERDLIETNFQNLGLESRLMIEGESRHGSPKAWVLGVRGYSGNTHKLQGKAAGDGGSEMDFLQRELHPGTDVAFPSYNYAIFTEYLLPLSSQFSLVPGARIEYLKTTADGTVFIPVSSIDIRALPVNKSSERWVSLFGLGAEYKTNTGWKLYANITENFRGINFNDLYDQNPNIVIDENLQDETGYTLDLGIMGVQIDDWFTVDMSIFHVSYNNRIGELTRFYGADSPTPFISYRLRTNISASSTWGIESYTREKIDLGREKALLFFQSITAQNSRYIRSEEESINSKLVEYSPNLQARLGIQLQWKSLGLQWLTSYVSQQYSDAQNTKIASQNALNGEIPSYITHDLSALFFFKNKAWECRAGINNLLDASYFTRRATGYPGPGILPAARRNAYISLAYRWVSRRENASLGKPVFSFD